MNIAISGQTATLPTLIDQATRLLANARTCAEVLEVKETAQVAYDAAKSAARIARAKEAHDTVIASILEAEGKAVAIHARAEIRLAEEYDAAQERGEVAKSGEQDRVRDSIPDGKTIPATAAEIGVNPKDVHNGRKLRAAEEADPGVIERSIGEMVEAGEEPTKAALARKIEQKPNKPPKPDPDPTADLALWLWGRFKEFERRDYLSLDPEAVVEKMEPHMQETVRRLLPYVREFLDRMEPSPRA